MRSSDFKNIILSKHSFFLVIVCWYGIGVCAEPDVRSVHEFKRKQGWFLASDVGALAVLGGFRDPLIVPLEATSIIREPRFSSGVQPSVGMVLGYDVWEYLAIGIKLGRGYVASAARLPSDINSPTDYALTHVDVALMGSLPVYQRWQLAGSVLVGFSTMTPAILPDVRRFGVGVGASLGVHYQTLLSGLFVGLDLNGRISLIPETGNGILPGIVSISLIPLIGYVF